jgi:hypothetical protein
VIPLSVNAILLTNFIYLVGLTQGALAIAVILRLTSARWSAHFYRLAITLALAAFPLGLLMMLLIFAAQGSLLYWIGYGDKLWHNQLFFMARNLVPFLLFYLAAGRLWLTGNGPVREAWRTAETLNNRLLVTGFWLLLSFVAYQTIASWDLGMILNYHFVDTLYSVFFILGSVYGGTALLVVAMAGAQKVMGTKAFAADQFNSMAQLILALSIFWFFVWWTQFMAVWFTNLRTATEPMYLRIFAYSPVFFASIILIAVVPFTVLIFNRARESQTAVTAVSISVLMGIWLERYLMVVPALVKQEMIPRQALLSPLNVGFTLLVFAATLLIWRAILTRYPQTLPPLDQDLVDDHLITEAIGWK